MIPGPRCKAMALVACDPYTHYYAHDTLTEPFKIAKMICERSYKGEALLSPTSNYMRRASCLSSCAT